MGRDLGFQHPPEIMTPTRLNPHKKGLAIGLTAGIGGGLVSLGGGTLVIPMLMGWAGLSPLAARGTALSVSLCTASMAGLIYAYHGMVDIRILLWVAVPALVVTPLAAAWSENWSPARLKSGFGVVVMLGGSMVIFRDQITTSPLVTAEWQVPYLLAVGVTEGLVAGIIGISGGPILAPLFVLGLGIPQQLAQGCSLLARLPAVLTGSCENWRLGNVQTTLLPSLAIGALIGAGLGSKIALMLPEQGLRFTFGLLLITLGLHYLHSSRRAPTSLPVSEWKR